MSELKSETNSRPPRTPRPSGSTQKLTRKQANTLMPAYMLQWEQMVKRDGIHQVAVKMSKTAAYRKYSQKYPYDYTERWDTLKSVDELADFIQDPTLAIEDSVGRKIDIDTIVANLSPRQLEVWLAMLEGKSIAEIQAEHDFNTAGAVRYNKHALKKKLYNYSPLNKKDDS